MNFLVFAPLALLNEDWLMNKYPCVHAEYYLSNVSYHIWIWSSYWDFSANCISKYSSRMETSIIHSKTIMIVYYSGSG